uniref:GntR family transcriptional regulator n=1 Tax=Thaumasiovibrio occultus TaxID=1891184 RepID=UPI000B3551A0|nr:GntR family transcriptional regulator [Thaumasiovibrio occultus]
MVKELDYSTGAKPLYAQLYDILVDKLHRGEYSKDDVLPTEADFQQMFGVSRITARRALSELANEGYVKRERGIGTLVLRNSKAPSINVTTNQRGDKAKKIERKNMSLTLVTPPQEVIEGLQLADNEQVVMLTRTLQREGETPSQINYIYLNLDIELDDISVFDRGLYWYLESLGHNIETHQDRLSAVLPNEFECKHLNISTDKPLLVRKRIGVDNTGKAIEFTVSKHISEDYEYIVEYR